MGSREDGGGDDVEHDEGFFFREEEEEEAGDEVEGLAVADFGVMGGKGAEDAAEGGEERAFWLGGREGEVWGGFEVDVVWEGAVEVAFDGFFVVFG